MFCIIETAFSPIFCCKEQFGSLRNDVNQLVLPSVHYLRAFSTFAFFCVEHVEFVELKNVSWLLSVSRVSNKVFFKEKI